MSLDERYNWTNPMNAIDSLTDESRALFPEEMVELDLCLPGWQVAALEEAAHQRGMTAGQLLRGVIQDYCTRTKPQTRGRRTIDT